MNELYHFSISVTVALPSDGDAREIRENTEQMLRRWFPNASEIAVGVHGYDPDPWSRKVA